MLFEKSGSDGGRTRVQTAFAGSSTRLVRLPAFSAILTDRLYRVVWQDYLGTVS